jgi:hypothetical protein
MEILEDLDAGQTNDVINRTALELPVYCHLPEFNNVSVKENKFEDVEAPEPVNKFTGTELLLKSNVTGLFTLLNKAST